MEDIEILKKNCADYTNTHNKAVDVLREANGQNQYIDIAKNIGIHKTTVSTLLKKAEKLGLVVKTNLGTYKKKAGILSYVPKRKTHATPPKTTQNIINKLSRPKQKKNFNISLGLIIPNALQINIEKMSDAYSHLFAVENLLRALIRKVLDKEVDWWKNRIPSGVQQTVTDEMKKTVYHAATRKDELEYTHLGQLKEIIINKKNWNHFLPLLEEKDKNAFTATIDKAIPSRNAVGHCIPLSTDDLKVVGVRFSDILKMIK